MNGRKAEKTRNGEYLEKEGMKYQRETENVERSASESENGNRVAKARNENSSACRNNHKSHQ